MRKFKLTATIDGEVIEIVKKIEEKENRPSLSNTVETLLKEAIDNRKSKKK